MKKTENRQESFHFVDDSTICVYYDTKCPQTINVVIAGDEPIPIAFLVDKVFSQILTVHLMDMSSLREKELSFFSLNPKLKDLSYAYWMGRRNLTEQQDETDPIPQYINSLIGREDELDRKWSELRLGEDVITSAIPFYCSGTQWGILQSPKKSEYILTDDMQKTISERFHQVYKEENVFVSKQCIPAAEMLLKWPEFFEQAWEWLVESNPYWIHRYDFQEYKSGTIHIPLYAIPVSLRTTWERKINVGTFLDRYNSFFTLPISQEELTALLKPICETERVISDVLLSQYDMARQMNSYLSLYLELHPEEAKLFGVNIEKKKKKKNLFKRLFENFLVKSYTSDKR